MPLNPPPVIDATVLLVKQQLIRSDMSRAAELEFCLRCADSTLATYQDAIDDFQVNFNTEFQGGLDGEVTILAPSGRGGDGSNTPILVFAAGASVVGGSTNVDVPPNCAVLVKKRTVSGGRHNRGRNYWPFIIRTADVSENGTIDPTFRAALQTVMTTFLANLAVDGTPMAIENKRFNQPQKPHFVVGIGASAVPVTAYIVDPLIATQRRRLGR